MARAERQQQLVGIILLNLDHFKTVNVKHGFGQGDNVLKQVAERLKKCTRKSDTLARLGSDEFAVILEGLTGKDGAIIPAQRILDTLSPPMTIDGAQIGITATIGIALFPPDARDLDGLPRSADAAMCDAKDHQRNAYRIYSPQLEFKTQRDEMRRVGSRRGSRASLRASAGAGRTDRRQSQQDDPVSARREHNYRSASCPTVQRSFRQCARIFPRAYTGNGFQTPADAPLIFRS